MRKIILALIIVSGFTKIVVAQDSLYYWRCKSFPAGDNALSILSSRIDNDTLADIITVLHSPKSIRFSKGKGNGHFTHQADFLFDKFPLTAQLTKVNADASIDLVAITCTKKDPSLTDPDSVFLEVHTNLNGVFSKHQKLFLYENNELVFSRSLTLADLNNDGKKDICVQLNYHIFTLLNVNGTFTLKSDYVSPDRQDGSLVIGNFDTDADKEIVTTNRTFISGPPFAIFKITKLEANSSFNWQSVGTQVLPDEGFIEANDYDQNNVDDLMLRSFGNVYTFQNDGTFNFTQIAQKTGVENDYKLCLEQLSGDGVLDLIEFSTTANSLKIYPGNSSGSFSATPDSINLKYASSYYIFNDLNGDGRKDLAVLHPWDDLFSVFLRNTNGTFIDYEWYNTDNYCCSDMEANDFDGDGISELTFLSTGYSNLPHNTCEVYFLKGLKNGNFKDDKKMGLARHTGDYGLDLTLADLNKDGSKEILCVKHEAISILATDPILKYSPKLDSAFMYDRNARVYPGDFDKDGNVDLLVTCLTTEQFLFHGSGQYNNFTMNYTNLDIWNMEEAFGLQDINNDGFDDILCYDYPNGIDVCYGNPSRTITRSLLFEVDELGSIMDYIVMDINGDHHKDIILFCRAVSFNPNYVVTILNDGANHFSFHQKKYVGTSASKFRMADMNNDSNPDIVCANNSQLVVLAGEGNGNFSDADYVGLDNNNTLFINPDNSTQKGFVVGDFNQDGRQDFAVNIYPRGLMIYYNMNVHGFDGGQTTGLKDPIPGKSIEAFNINIYPNPTTGKLFLLCKRHDEIATLKIYNTDREIITLVSPNTHEIDLSSYQQGMYYIVGYSQNNTHLFSAKIIKTE